MKALVGAFNQEKALVGAFSVIVQPVMEPMEHYTALSRIFLVPFLRIGSLMIITQWAGINVITAYMVNIFIQAGSSIDPNLAPILVCGVQQVIKMF